MEAEKTNIEELIKRLPEGYKHASKETKALERKREIQNPADLIRLIMLYLTGGYSQIEMSVIANELGIAKISDTGFLKRFAKCKEWIEWIVTKMLPQPVIGYDKPKGLESYTMVALDASDVSEKGRSGRIFRLHYAFDIMKLCRYFIK